MYYFLVIDDLKLVHFFTYNIFLCEPLRVRSDLSGKINEICGYSCIPQSGAEVTQSYAKGHITHINSNFNLFMSSNLSNLSN